MAVAEMLSAERFLLHVHAAGKAELLAMMAATFDRAQVRLEPQAIAARALERERLASTYIGNGVAIPHVLVPGAQTKALVVAAPAEPIDYDGDGKHLARLVFLLLSPADRPGIHVKTLAAIARLCDSSTLVGQIARASAPEVAIALIEAAESAQGQPR
jgi:mannitol/fructose-specific phosphotransferase system IIA component (Ntr-type)